MRRVTNTRLSIIVVGLPAFLVIHCGSSAGGPAHQVRLRTAATRRETRARRPIRLPAHRARRAQLPRARTKASCASTARVARPSGVAPGANGWTQAPATGLVPERARRACPRTERRATPARSQPRAPIRAPAAQAARRRRAARRASGRSARDSGRAAVQTPAALHRAMATPIARAVLRVALAVGPATAAFANFKADRAQLRLRLRLRPRLRLRLRPRLRCGSHTVEESPSRPGISPSRCGISPLGGGRVDLEGRVVDFEDTPPRVGRSRAALEGRSPSLARSRASPRCSRVSPRVRLHVSRVDLAIAWHKSRTGHLHANRPSPVAADERLRRAK
jgi:hypothetical protein